MVRVELRSQKHLGYILSPEIVSDGDNDFGYVFVLSNKYKSPDVLQLPPPLGFLYALSVVHHGPRCPLTRTEIGIENGE